MHARTVPQQREILYVKMCGSENLQRYVKYLASAVTPLLDLGSTSDLLEPTAENFLLRLLMRLFDYSIPFRESRVTKYLSVFRTS